MVLSRTTFLWVLVLAQGLFTSPAYSQDSVAEGLFRSAQEASLQGDWRTACDRFEESNRLEPAPGTVMNLARCREMLGQVASAWKRYNEAAQRLPEGDKRVRFAQGKSEELSARVPHLILLPAEGVETEVSVVVNGVEFEKATFGVPLPFDPGSLTIVVRAPGHEDNEFELILGEGQRVEHRLLPGPPVGGSREPGAPAALTSESAATTISPWATVSLVSGGVGIAAVIFGSVWIAIEASNVHSGCEDGLCNPQGLQASARGRSAVYLTGAGAVVGAVGIGIGSYLVLKRDERSSVAIAPLREGGILTYRGQL